MYTQSFKDTLSTFMHKGCRINHEVDTLDEDVYHVAHITISFIFRVMACIEWLPR